MSRVSALQLYNKSLTKPINIGIGLNTGLLVLGTIGTSYRMEGTVLSDAVNIASRTETLNKTYSTNLLITHDTYEKLINPSKFFIRKIRIPQ